MNSFKVFFAMLVCFYTVAIADIGFTGKWGDQGNGTYYNPIIPADYSDEDIIRVDSTFYMISSTMQLSPGMIVLESKDLVNWKIIGHVVTDMTTISSAYNYTAMNSYGKGVWAGSIRYYAGKFRVYFGTPDQGYFMSTAINAAGPWDTLTKVTMDNNPALPGSGWDDCCPFWDSDGTGYFVGSKTSAPYTIHLFQMTADGKKLLASSNTVIYSGPGAEANKILKVNGYYYFFHSENSGGTGRNMFMLRSASIWGTGGSAGHAGTYEKQQLFKNNGIDREPNQGGIVQTPSGSWYFVTHHGLMDLEGRPCSLLPVTWTNNWPMIGIDGNGDGFGEMVWSAKKPIAGFPCVLPQTSDEFDSAVLSPQWEWNYQPRPDKWSLVAKPGYLRLSAFTPLANDNLFKAGNTISQRFIRGDSGEATVKIDIANMANGQEAGLCHFNGGSTYATIGVLQNSSGSRFFRYKNGSTIVTGSAIAAMVTTVWFRSEMNNTTNTAFKYSIDGTNFTTLGAAYALAKGGYRGDRIGVYSFNNTAALGYVDVDWFHYTFAGPKAGPGSTVLPGLSGRLQGQGFVPVRCRVGNSGKILIQLPMQLGSHGRAALFDISGKSIPFSYENSGAYLSVDKVSTGIFILKIMDDSRTVFNRLSFR